MTKKVICYSLWSDHPFYNYGMLENALVAKEIYPDWIIKVYYEDNNIDMKILNALSTLDNVELVKMPYDGNNSDNSKMFWRFTDMFSDDDIIYMCHDSDSIITWREKLAVDEWLNSDMDFHIVRSHPYHTVPIVGFMFGARNKICRPLKEQFDNYNRESFKGCDQNFLRDVVYPHVVDRAFIHASHCKYEGDRCKPFPENELTVNENFCGAYNRHTPRAFKFLGEEEKILDTLHEYQKM